MKRKILCAALLAALAALCLCFAAACSTTNYSINNMSQDIAFLVTPGSYTENGSTLDPLRAGETRTYDVVLHNGYDRDTLKVFANDVQLTFNPNDTYNDDCEMTGFQVVGTVDITDQGKNIDVTVECESKTVNFNFVMKEGAEDPYGLVEQISVGGVPLKETGAVYSAKYTDIVAAGYSVAMTGPKIGLLPEVGSIFSWNEIKLPWYRQYTPARNEYSLTLPALLKEEMTVTIDPSMFDAVLWFCDYRLHMGALDVELGDGSPSGQLYNSAAGVSVTISVDVATAQACNVDLLKAKLYINDKAFDVASLEDGKYVIGSDEAPIDYIADENLADENLSDEEIDLKAETYEIRLEGFDFSDSTGIAALTVDAPQGVVTKTGMEFWYVDADAMYYDVRDDEKFGEICFDLSGYDGSLSYVVDIVKEGGESFWIDLKDTDGAKIREEGGNVIYEYGENPLTVQSITVQYNANENGLQGAKTINVSLSMSEGNYKVTLS